MAQSLPELPPDILSEIFSRLPIKTLFTCRSVCKAFLNLTFSDPPLNFLRSSDPAQSLIIQFGELNKPTTLIHLVDSELDTSFGSGERVLLKPMFQIPKYPVKYFKKCRLYAGDENKFVLVNSCNGLLYIAERGVCERSFVCNPITDEYVTLVEFNEQNNQRKLTMGSWFGFSPAENQYKVLRLFSTLTGKPWQIGFRQEFWAQVHVVGSDSWRYLEDKPLSEYLSWDTCSVFLNGTINWLCKYPELSKFIIFFDFQKEKFGEILPPPSFRIDQRLSKLSMSIGVLGGCLCVSDHTQYFDIWVMKEYGCQESWKKEFTIDTTIPTGEPLRGPLRPLQMLRDGKILLIWLERVLVCYDPKNKKFRFFEFIGVESLAKVIPYTPTFLRLKDALMVDNVTVQNITSRYELAF
ncbi:UNVERIFIED_CONTAM: putative F-box/LRR-repeat/kelch-repeat protein [Sesamum radiatum]|uniref:F-box/LRR-repeat/kelch-repeat protein n=1 Tax=Sesamum radiatum TaxID=300843 RepID=A0AAW2L466_SESRA